MATKKSQPTVLARKPAAPRKKKPVPPDLPEAITSAEHIRVRAYYLSLEERGTASDPLANWLRAELELTARRSEA